MSQGDRWVELNVGGEIFLATIETLTKFPNSKLAEIAEMYNIGIRYDGLLDIDPVYFRAVLNWLR